MGKIIGFNRPGQHKGKAQHWRKGWSRVAELALIASIGVAGGLCYDQYQDGVGIWDKAAMANMASAISDVRAKSQGGDVSYRAALRVVDGDTFWYQGVKIRIADIDAPETHPPRCAYEADLGMRATRRLEQLLRAGPLELETIMGRDEDQYGRKLRIVVRDGQSLGDQLVAEGLARRWAGRRMPWC